MEALCHAYNKEEIEVYCISLMMPDQQKNFKSDICP